jgi:hypothetical protein
MTTKATYRTDLQTKLLALEDGGYGDFEYSTAELDTYIELSVARLFPAVYQRVSAEGLALTQYGSALYGYVQDASIIYERVFLVEDATELDAIVGWSTRPDKVVGIDTETYTTVNVYWTDAYTLPSGDNTPTGIPAIYEPLINLGALIEALEARQDTGVRGEPQPTGPFFETQLIDRLAPRYDALKAELSMALPAMVV